MRRLSNLYKALIFDGVVLSRKTGAGVIKRPVLVVLGIRYDGKRRSLIFGYHHQRVSLNRNASSVDGGKGLLAALPFLYPNIPIQRCWVQTSSVPPPDITASIRSPSYKEFKRFRKTFLKKGGPKPLYDKDEIVEPGVPQRRQYSHRAEELDPCATMAAPR